MALGPPAWSPCPAGQLQPAPSRLPTIHQQDRDLFCERQRAADARRAARAASSGASAMHRALEGCEWGSGARSGWPAAALPLAASASCAAGWHAHCPTTPLPHYPHMLWHLHPCSEPRGRALGGGPAGGSQDAERPAGTRGWAGAMCGCCHAEGMLVVLSAAPACAPPPSHPLSSLPCAPACLRAASRGPAAVGGGEPVQHLHLHAPEPKHARPRLWRLPHAVGGLRAGGARSGWAGSS